MATADAMWHLQTSFFPALCYMNRPDRENYAQWQEWFQEKVTRDYTVKIFFTDEKKQVKKDYEALVHVFGKEALKGS